MRSNIKTFLIAFALLGVFCLSSVAAPKAKKGTVKSSSDEKTEVSSTQKVIAPAERTPVKEPSQSAAPVTTITETTKPAEIQPPIFQSTSVVSAAYSIDWFVIAAGGGSGSSTNYNMDGTVGQTAVGEGTSTNYELNSGFWQNFAPAGCCISPRGDANNDGTNCNILDLTFLVDRIFRGGPPAVCLEEADMNGDTISSNILDLTYTVDRIFRGGPAPGACL
jgi:hypothetical protein